MLERQFSPFKPGLYLPLPLKNITKQILIEFGHVPLNLLEAFENIRSPPAPSLSNNLFKIPMGSPGHLKPKRTILAPQWLAFGHNQHLTMITINPTKVFRISFRKSKLPTLIHQSFIKLLHCEGP